MLEDSDGGFKELFVEGKEGGKGVCETGAGACKGVGKGEGG